MPPFVGDAVNIMLLPVQILVDEAEIRTDAGKFGLTVIERLAVAFEQPPVPVTEYVIVAVPAATPVITPVLEFTVATDVLLLVHVQPTVAL